MGIAVLVIVGLIAAGLAGGILADAPSRREVADLMISDVDFKRLHDGTYTGDFTGKKSHMRDAEVEVTIHDGTITEIKILKGALDKKGNPAELTGGKTINDIYTNVIKKQTLQVDVISGATLTSKAHLKALENALNQAEAN